MKKAISIGTAVAACLTVSAFGGEISNSERILGIEVAAAQIQADTPYNPITPELDHDGNDVEFGLRLGAQNEMWRTLLVLNYFDSSDDDQEYWKGMASFDYFITQEYALKPYIGLNVGYMNYQSTGIDDGGFLYGGEAGVSYRLNESVEMDLLFRYSASGDDNVDHVSGVVFGLNYIF